MKRHKKIKKAIKRMVEIAKVALTDDQLDGYEIAVLERIIKTAKDAKK